jgi:hypothetical protein
VFVALAGFACGFETVAGSSMQQPQLSSFAWSILIRMIFGSYCIPQRPNATDDADDPDARDKIPLMKDRNISIIQIRIFTKTDSILSDVFWCFFDAHICNTASEKIRAGGDN